MSAYQNRNALTVRLLEEKSRAAALALGCDLSFGTSLPKEDFLLKKSWKIHGGSTRIIGSTSSADGRGERFITATSGGQWLFILSEMATEVEDFGQFADHPEMIEATAAVDKFQNWINSLK